MCVGLTKHENRAIIIEFRRNVADFFILPNVALEAAQGGGGTECESPTAVTIVCGEKPRAGMPAPL